eukprot:NODE_9404_length_263_cov_12.135514_g8663_i0.p2 GENE.NODE_9404_length_263_cov_12.135514_g8663_i0~~NODE_9404_length_263_cov_12.135514_g8663_i0.p2  ORF type:complete len:73 (+),score=19.85 NODE_9404_length_263_cov_12.135514_g8663_i0:33-251(+)
MGWVGKLDACVVCVVCVWVCVCTGSVKVRVRQKRILKYCLTKTPIQNSMATVGIACPAPPTGAVRPDKLRVT